MEEEEYLEDDCIDSGISIKFGKRTDSLDTLERLFEEEAEKLKTTIEVPDHGKVSAGFWTAYLPSELIGVAYYSKNENGEVVCELEHLY